VWPDSFHVWREGVPTLALFQATCSNLFRSPVLAANRPVLRPHVFRACERAIDLADAYRRYPGFFAHHAAFRLWLREAAEREARRYILDLPQVQACLALLGLLDQQILYWYYVEGFTPRQIGHLLFGTAPGCEQRGLQHLHAAQAQLLQALTQAGWGCPLWTFPL
jgi:hypothetical protein